MNTAIAGSNLSRQTKGMKGMMLKSWRNEKRCIKQKEMSIPSDGQKKKETGSQ